MMNIENQTHQSNEKTKNLKNLRKCRHCHKLFHHWNLNKHENKCVVYSQNITKENKCMWNGCGRTFPNRTSANRHFGQNHANQVSAGLTKNNDPTKNVLVPSVLDNTIVQENITIQVEPPPIGKNDLGLINFENDEQNMDQVEPDLGDVPKEKSTDFKKCYYCHKLFLSVNFKPHAKRCVIYSQYITKDNKCIWPGCGCEFPTRLGANKHFGRKHANQLRTGLTKNNPIKNVSIPCVLDKTIVQENTTFEFRPPPIGKDKLGSINIENDEQSMDQELGDVPKEISLPEDFMSSEILVDPKSKISTKSNPNLLQNEKPIFKAFPENLTTETESINTIDFENIPRMEKLNLIQHSLNELRKYIQNFQGDAENLYEFINTEINFNKLQIETMVKNITVVSADREEIKLLKIQVDEILGNWRRKCFKKTGRFPTSPPPAPPEASTSAPCASSASRRVKSSESVKIHPIKNLDGISLLSQINSTLYICPFEDCSNR